MSNMNYSISTNIPHELSSYQQVAGCFCLHEDRFLLLKRHPEKSQGDMWCLPAGKKEHNETPQETAVRELFEETGIHVSSSDLHKINSFCIEFPKTKVIFHTFGIKLNTQPTLSIKQDESIDSRWVNYQDLNTLSLIIGGKEILAECRRFLEN